MNHRGLPWICSFLLLSGCLYGAREKVDWATSQSSRQTYDLQPPMTMSPNQAGFIVPNEVGTNQTPDGRPVAQGQSGHNTPGVEGTFPPAVATDIRTVGYLTDAPVLMPTSSELPPERKAELNVPVEIPGAEVPPITTPNDAAQRRRAAAMLYPPLPALIDEPQAVLGVYGRPYSLADLQSLGAANSPALRQAAADVETARGNMIAAAAYPNPIVSYQMTPSSNGSTPGTDGVGVDQTIKTGGKLKIATAAAEMDLHNAELALRRARSDLATQIRTAYFTFLVAKETVRVTKGMARFSDEIYNLQARMLAGGFAAPYEPAALRAQANLNRLAYFQAVQSYIFGWKQLVAAINLRQLPLSSVTGRVDQMIPLYDYDAVLAYVVRNHTDVLTAHNGIEKARYQLKLAQIAVLPDVDVNMAVLKDFSADPKQTLPTLTLGVPLPVWDRNQGAIFAAEASLIRAQEEPHKVEMRLTNSLAASYGNYTSALAALNYYRNYILPDQVRYYRGTFHRRDIDASAQFGDLVQAQQSLTTNVSTYLQTLGQLWTSVVNVADLIQTDDLFAYSRPEAVPALPDVNQLPPMPCCHPPVAGGQQP